MNLVYVAPCAMEYVIKSTRGFVPVRLYDPGVRVIAGEIGTNGRDRFIALSPGVFQFEDGVLSTPGGERVALRKNGDRP